jgi:hypothetical protein
MEAPAGSLSGSESAPCPVNPNSQLVRQTSPTPHPCASSSMPSTCIRARSSTPAKIGDRLPAEQLARHAVALLAVEHALADRVLASRWVDVADALTYGATVEPVATAMDLTAMEVTAGLQSWADVQRRFGHITDVAHDAVLALLGEEGDR